MKMMLVAGLLGLGSSLVGGAVHAQPQSQAPQAWRGCCGATPWPQGQGMMGGGGMMGGYGGGMMGGNGRGIMGGSAARNHFAMMGGLPKPYEGLTNPLPQTAATIDRGATVYTANCASCHGATGLGDGPGAKALNPRPANLAWLSRMPMSRWDAFMFWTVSEGGAPVGSAMPSFKANLSEHDRWAVVAYIQAHLPQANARR